MKNNKVVYNFMLFISLLLFIKPLSIHQNHTLNLVFNSTLFIYMICILIRYIYNGKITKVQIYIWIYMLILLISTIINNNSIIYFLKINLPIICLCIYIEQIINSNQINNFFKIFKIYFSTIVIINFLSIIFKDNRDYTLDGRTFFLGYDNDFAPILILGTYILYISDIYKKDKLSYFSCFIIVVCIFSVFLVKSATIKIGMMVFMLFLALSDIKYKNFKFLYNFLINISIILFILVVFFNIQNLFPGFIEKILDRNVTFTGRINIWKSSIDLMLDNNIFLGTGVVENNLRKATQKIYHAHSTYLQVLLEGGLIALIAFINLLKLPSTYLEKINVSVKESDKKIIFAICYGIFTYLIMGLVEVYVENTCFYILIILLTYYYKIINERKI